MPQKPRKRPAVPAPALVVRAPPLGPPAEARAMVPVSVGDMATELHIIFGGTTPGLAENRLSLGAFGTPLDLLRAALQRIASELAAEAKSTQRRRARARVAEASAEYGKKGGRLAKRAEVLDVQLEKIEDGGSVKLLFLVTTLALPGPRQGSFLADDLPRRTVERFLEGVDDESHGRPFNFMARKFLGSLPPTVDRQTYDLVVDGEVKRHVEVGKLQMAPIQQDDLPVLVELVGQIVGVGFDPGRSHVRVMHGHATSTLDATAEQVEHALTLRGGEVRALAVSHADGRRLLRLLQADAPQPVLPREQLFDRWGGLLTRLAK